MVAGHDQITLWYSEEVAKYLFVRAEVITSYARTFSV